MKKITTVILLLSSLIGFSSTTVQAKSTDESDNTTLRFYLVRHGQTYSNIKEMTIGGGGNAQLTAKGRYDARSLGLGLDKVSFISAYSSTLGRAYETANNILTGRNMPVTQIANLKDISWGEVEGGRIDDLTDKFGHSGNDFEFYFGKYNDPTFKSPVKAENMYDFSVRFEGALRDIAKNHQGQSGNILAVAHSSMAFYLQKYRSDKPLSGLSNTSVSVLEFKNGEFTLIDFNNTDYLTQGYKKEKALAPLEISVIINPMTILSDMGIMEGTTDSDLNKSGISASQKLNNHIRKMNYVAAYTSTLGRAHETANIALANTNIPVTENRFLDEIFLGQWEAEKISNLNNLKSEQVSALFSNNNVIDFVSPVGGETGSLAAYRLGVVLKDIGIHNEFTSGKVAVFTHPLVFKAFLNQAIPDYRLSNSKDVQVVTLQYKNEVFKVKDVQTFKGK